MYRYLLNLSYIGTNFRGAQRQVPHNLPFMDDPLTIQGQIEMGLKLLKPKICMGVITSSRTDAGVHAMHSAMHVDMTRYNEQPYEPTIVTQCLNKHFQKQNLPIRILSTFLVPDSFHCRANAVARTYLYRLVVVKSDRLNAASIKYHIPIEEFNRALYLCTNTFDIDKLKDASRLFLGLHDFRTFMGRGSKQPDKMTRRVIDRLEIIEANPTCYSSYSWPYCIDDKIEDYKYYHIICKSSGFLYNQVRRTVGALIAVAQGKVTSRDIKFMLEIPSHNSWDPRIKPAPASGLYLCEVAYKECDIQTFKATLEK